MTEQTDQTSPGTDLVHVPKPLAEQDDLSGLDVRLLEMASKYMTGEQMAAELGGAMSPERCVLRVREILRSKTIDLFGQQEQKALLLMDLIKLRDMIFDRLEVGEDVLDRHGIVHSVDAAPAMYSAAIRLLKEWRETIESMQNDVDAGNVRIRDAHAAVMISAIEVMFDRFMLRLEHAGHQIDRALAMSIMEEVMPIGFGMIQDRVG